MQSRRLLALIVLLLRSVDATTWIVDPSTGSEYTVVAQSGKRFTRCESACSAIGSSMPCIRTSGESDFVRKKVADGDNFWIGLYQKSLCSWKWTSSSCNPNDFDDWVPGQPNNYQGESENCAYYNSEDHGWYDTPCSDHEKACVCEKGLTTTEAFAKWDGPVLQYGIKSGRSTRAATFGIAVVLGLLAAIGGFGYVAINVNCPDVIGKRYPLLFFGLGHGAVPGCLLLMASFLGSDDANCRDDDPFPFELAGWLGIALFFGTAIIFKVWTTRENMLQAKADVESKERSTDRKSTMRTQRSIEASCSEVHLKGYIDHVAESNRTVEDAITGNKLEVDTQTILIGVDASGASAKQFVSVNRLLFACLFVLFPYLVMIHFLLLSRMVWAHITHEPKWILFCLFVYCSIILQFVVFHFVTTGIILKIRQRGSREIRVATVGEENFLEGILADYPPRFCEIRLDDGTRMDLWVWLLSNWRTKELLVPENIRIGQCRDEYNEVKDIKELLELILKEGDAQPPILIRAKAGTGKTWSARQLCRHLSVHEGQDSLHAYDRMIPLLIYVQGLVRDLKHESDKKAQTVSEILNDKELVELHINLTYHDHPEWRDVLLEAFKRRRLLVVLDGVDEAADLSHMIETFVFDQLVEQGHRVVVTSRYEGVKLDDRYKDFVVMDLSPLSEEQQRQVIHNQLGENEHFDHLMTFSHIRSEHDRIYASEAFPRERDRNLVEEVSAPDKFLLDEQHSEGERLRRTALVGNQKVARRQFDPSMRLHSHNNADRIVARNTTGEVKSDFLTENTLNPLLLDELQGRLDQLPIDVGDQVIEDEVKGLLPHEKGEEETQQMKWLKKLAKLSRKKKQRPSELWREIVERTDEIYEIAERFEPIFRQAVAALLRKCSMNTATALSIGSLKDPIRSHEKALDDYEGRFEDNELAESCLPDVIRFRALTEESKSIEQIQKKLLEGFQCEVDGHIAKLELIRVKNKFRDLDPTHFRNILNNVRLHYQGQSFLGEIQLHHEKIIKHNEDSDAHHHYNYFRALMKEDYDEGLSKQLDFVLETSMVVFEEVVKVPVLLSMLAVVLKGEADGAMIKLPTDIFSLYSSATSFVVEEAVPKYKEEGLSDSDITECLRTLAYHNQLAHRRIFTSKNAVDWLQGKPSLITTWQKMLHHHDSPPLIKVLTAASATGEGGEYQYSHLSFQEFFFLETIRRSSEEGLPDGFKWETIDDKIEFFRDKFNDNITRLGGTIIGEKLFSQKYGSDLSFCKCFSNPDQTLRLCRVMSKPGHTIRKLTITGCSFDKASLELLGHGIGLKASKVETLDLHGNGLDDFQLEYLISSGVLRGNLKELILASNLICGALVDDFVEEIEGSDALVLLDLRDNLLCGIINNSKSFEAQAVEARSKLREVASEKEIKLVMWCPIPPKAFKIFMAVSILSGGVVLAIWGAFNLVFPFLYLIVKSLYIVLEFLKGVLRPCLAYSDDAPLWLPARPAVEHPLFIYGKPLHLLCYPLTILCGLPFNVLIGVESQSPLIFLLAIQAIIQVPFIGAFQDIGLMLLFAPYEMRQNALDFIQGDGGSPFVLSTTQTAMCNLARIGPKTVYWAMLLLGVLPAGATDAFDVQHPFYSAGYQGGGSAIGRAFVRGEARTVAVLLYCCPKLQLTGNCWKQHHIEDREDLMRWIAEKLKVDDGDAEDIRQSLRIQARGATTPVLKAAVEVEMAMAETEDTRAPIPV